MRRLLGLLLGLVLLLVLPAHADFLDSPGARVQYATASPPPPSAFTLIQKAVTADGSSTGITSIAITVTAVGSGNTVMGECQYTNGSSNPATTASDNAAGNPNAGKYHVVGNVYDASDTNGLFMFYGVNITGGPTTITLSGWTGNNQFTTCGILEFSGVTSFDASSGATSSTPASGTATFTSATLTPAQSGELIVGSASCLTGGCTSSGGQTFAAGSGFTLENNTSHNGSNYTNDQIADEYQTYNSTVAIGASFSKTYPVSSQVFAAGTMAFK